jgi:hypothetical protein
VVGEAREAAEQVVLVFRDDGGGAERLVDLHGAAIGVGVGDDGAVELVDDGGLLETVRRAREAARSISLRMSQASLFPLTRQRIAAPTRRAHQRV